MMLKSFKINKDVISKRMIDKGGKAYDLVGDEVLKKSKPYIPLDTMETINSGEQKAGQVRYKTPYVKYIYYEKLNFKGSSLRGNYWFERMKTDKAKEILKTLADRVGGKVK